MYAVVGASGNTGSATAGALIETGAAVRAVVRDPAKGESWKARGAEVAVADLEDVSSLTRAFEGVDAAYVLNPPAYTLPDLFARAETVAANIAQAVRSARLPRLVVLSSIGAHLASGTGNIRTNGILERVLGRLECPGDFPAPRLFHGKLGLGCAGGGPGRRAAQLSLADRPRDSHGLRDRHRRRGRPGAAGCGRERRGRTRGAAAVLSGRRCVGLRRGPWPDRQRDRGPGSRVDADAGAVRVQSATIESWIEMFRGFNGGLIDFESGPPRPSAATPRSNTPFARSSGEVHRPSCRGAG